MLKTFSHLEIFTFLSWPFGYVEKRLDKKIKVNSKLYDDTMHILSSISRSNGNQAIKFGQLVEHNIGNIFLQKSCRKWGRETSCFLKKLYRYKLNTSGQHLSFNIFW